MASVAQRVPHRYDNMELNTIRKPAMAAPFGLDLSRLLNNHSSLGLPASGEGSI
jgi:hypothetical protein